MVKTSRLHREVTSSILVRGIISNMFTGNHTKITRCEHLCKDRLGYYCGKDLPIHRMTDPSRISETRRVIANPNLHRVYCLNPHNRCPCLYEDMRKI